MLTIYSDASLEGWGATDSTGMVGGRLDEDVAFEHINSLELFAAKLALEKLACSIHDCHIQLKIDNTTAVTHINRMGGSHSVSCNFYTQLIWHWAQERNVWLSAAYIPGKDNVVADFHSHCFKDNTEWTLDYAVFQSICHIYSLPLIDLFASCHNKQLDTYVSWYPDPHAWAVDAFSIPWHTLLFYAFPPFSLVARVLKKINREEAAGILVVPKWTTQAWFPVLLSMLISHPREIRPHKQLLTLPLAPDSFHPLHKKLVLLAVHLSGTRCKVLAYQHRLQSFLPLMETKY